MITEFKNLPELFDFFKDEDTCVSFLEKQRWNGSPFCPSCGCRELYITKSRSKLVKSCNDYRCKQCDKKFGARYGTIFESSKIPLRTWYAAIYLVVSAKKGISSLQIADNLGVTQKTGWFLLHRIRETFKERAPIIMNGIVEADETYVGGKNKNRHKDKKIEGSQGRSAKDKTPVVGLLERDGKVATFVVTDTEAKTLHPIVTNSIAKDAVLVTDSYHSYKGLGKRYNHVMVKHVDGNSDKYFVVDGRFHTQNIENFWSILKRGIIGIYHFVSPKHLHRYCDEFGYRYNNRKITSNARFDLAIQSSVDKRLMYKVLIS